MDYPESFQRTSQIAELALNHIRENGIAANPRNFMIWYTYFSGSNAELKKSLDVLIANDQEFTELRNVEIFEEFFGAETTLGRVRHWGERIESAAGKILSALEASEKGTERYGQSLKNFSGDIEGVTDVSEIREMVAGIVAETKAMDAHVARLQTEIGSSAREISALKENLKTARRDAMTDGLTGLANRKCFDEKLMEASVDAVDTGEPLSLILADLDHFKKFNDTHGHQVGDQVLKLVGRLLIQSVKGQDTAARYGGEEFALILPNTDIAGAAMLAENIRKKIAAKKLVKKGTDRDFGPLTLSMGVTAYVPGESLGETIRRADAAMYAAKKAGRNKVVTDERFKAPEMEDA